MPTSISEVPTSISEVPTSISEVPTSISGAPKSISEVPESHGFYTDIAQDTIDNDQFRTDIITLGSLQLVVMSIPPNGEIGEETHDTNTQFTRIESGTGVAIIGEETFALAPGSAVIIPPGVKHNILNLSSSEPLKLYSLYSPPEDRVVDHDVSFWQPL